MKNMIRLVDNISGERLMGSKTTIKALVYRRFREYKLMGKLKGVVLIKDTYYIG